jgi:muconolactone D-isomerase
MEFLVEIEFTRPEGVSDETVEYLRHIEAQRAAELADSGQLLRLWRRDPNDPKWRNIGLWQTSNRRELEETLGTLPLIGWARVSITQLSHHPSDPPARSATQVGGAQ